MSFFHAHRPNFEVQEESEGGDVDATTSDLFASWSACTNSGFVGIGLAVVEPCALDAAAAATSLELKISERMQVLNFRDVLVIFFLQTFPSLILKFTIKRSNTN